MLEDADQERFERLRSVQMQEDFGEQMLGSLNIDFLNTFLLTYRVFTDGITVLEALKTVFFQPEPPDSPSSSNG